jgi:deoxyadenosine/deoxycytidine kinase
MFFKRIKSLQTLDTIKEGLVILDRWVEEDPLFPKNQQKLHIVDDKRGYNIYKNLTAVMMEMVYKMKLVPDLFIFLDSDVETCIRNIKLRNDESEKKIKPEYIEGML